MAGFNYTLGINELSSKKHKLTNALLAEFVGKLMKNNEIMNKSARIFYYHSLQFANDKLIDAIFHAFLCLHLYFFPGIFLLNFFACAACTFGDQTMMSFAFGLTVFVAVMVSKKSFVFFINKMYVLITRSNTQRGVNFFRIYGHAFPFLDDVFLNWMRYK